jgi:hypothetical protein
VYDLLCQLSYSRSLHRAKLPYFFDLVKHLQQYPYSMSLAYTTHLGERLQQRKIPRSQVDLTISQPDRVEQTRDGKRYRRQFGNQILTAVVTVTKSNQQLVLSAWIDPPNPGTKDARQKTIYSRYKSAKGMSKLWLSLRLGLGWY